MQSLYSALLHEEEIVQAAMQVILRGFYMKKNIIILLSLIFVFSGQIVLAADANCNSGGPSKDCYGLNSTVGKTEGLFTEEGVPELAGQLIGQVLAFVGVLFFALIIWAGFKWMTAQGNAKQTEEARDMMIRAVVGLIIIFSAYAITSFIGGVAQDPSGTQVTPAASK